MANMERRVSAKGEHLYECLGIPKTSTQDDIKKAYRKVNYIKFLFLSIFIKLF